MGIARRPPSLSNTRSVLQVLQSLRDGVTTVAEVPTPAPGANQLLVRTVATVISAGTERMLVDFGRANWIEKARSQPDKVRQVFDKVRTDGLAPTLDSIRAKLDQPIPLGYCQAGIVEAVGRSVTGFAAGDRVVTNGPHAEFVRVAPTLAARIPDGVAFEHAAFTPLAAIALQGIRLAAPTLGETFVVYGLGLIGQLAVQLCRAAGCRVVGIDRSADRVRDAVAAGALGVVAADGVDVPAAVLAVTGGVGADAVLLTLAADSDEPMHLAATMSRKRGRIVLVGVTGLALQRDDFFKKELTFQVSCSYGPGRYDSVHEESGVDYPLPYVRWTEGRNFEAVLQLMADGRLSPAALVSHQLPIADAATAYDLVASGQGGLGIVLQYPERPSAADRTIHVNAVSVAAGTGTARVGMLGAGGFSAKVLIPAFRAAGASLEVVASSAGVTAATAARQHGFARATTDTATVCADPAVDCIVVATRHDSHARWALAALGAGKHIFVEKPLALRETEVTAIGDAARAADRLVCVGFNRRFARDVQSLRRVLASRTGPAQVIITVNAGALPAGHWTLDPEIGGGRLVGEACHFIDLGRFLVASPIHGATVAVARRGGVAIEDIASIQLTHDDGSLVTVHYLANGHRSFPKERVEVFFDGQVVRLDNLRRVESWGVEMERPGVLSGQDKGHAALVAAFVAAVRDGGPAPIPLDEVLEVSGWSARIADVARAGGGPVTRTPA
jgi:predicted dehydrogenase/threonine dehydrogenase-like Zn-dependent dehydrogenase